MASTTSPLTPAQGDGQTGPVPSLTYARLRKPLGPEPTVLVIGYPAPAAVQIVERLLATDARTIACVVPHDMRSEAARTHRGEQEAGRIRLFEGSADVPGLGLPCTAWRILDTTDEIYGVASRHEIAAGHIQDFADECPRLREVHLVAQDPAKHDAPPRKSKGALFRRLRGLLSVPAPVRTTFSTLTTGLALGVARVGLAVPFVRTAGPWTNLLDFDLEAVLSREDLEHDLWPGLRPAT